MKVPIWLACIIVLLTACTPEIEPFKEEPISPIADRTRCNPKDICCFDLSDKIGTYELYSKWEFVAFQTQKGSSFDNLSCNARIAEFALGGEDYENIIQVVLSLSRKSSSIISCENIPSFFFRSFNHEIEGCYETDPQGNLKFNFSPENIVYLPSPAGTTLPVLEFENKIRESLLVVESYEIESNKLYLNMKGRSDTMVFLALEN